MKTLLRLGILVLVVFAATIALRNIHSDHDPIIQVKTGDAAMEAAITKARATIDTFWKAYEHPGPGEKIFALKVAVPTTDGSQEHIWVTSVSRLNNKFTGVLNNRPEQAG